MLLIFQEAADLLTGVKNYIYNISMYNVDIKIMHKCIKNLF